MTEVIGVDHIYIAVSDLARSATFYDGVMMQALGFRKSNFMLSNEPHIQYFNRHFGYVLRPVRRPVARDAYAPGMHHLCFRVESVADVICVSDALRRIGIDASAARQHSEYAADYWATFFEDPDGLRLEVTNYRQERRERHDHWDALQIEAHNPGELR